MAGVARFERPEGLRRATVGQRAPRALVRHQHQLVRIKDLGRFGHEMHPRENDHIGVGAFGVLRQLQRVADRVGHVLDVRLLVIMRQDDGVKFFF